MRNTRRYKPDGPRLKSQPGRNHPSPPCQGGTKGGFRYTISENAWEDPASGLWRHETGLPQRSLPP